MKQTETVDFSTNNYTYSNDNKLFILENIFLSEKNIYDLKSNF